MGLGAARGSEPAEPRPRRDPRDPQARPCPSPSCTSSSSSCSAPPRVAPRGSWSCGCCRRGGSRGSLRGRPPPVPPAVPAVPAPPRGEGLQPGGRAEPPRAPPPRPEPPARCACPWPSPGR
ncbi:unnamed protein product, partial [Coccothraustes coccothraustes]